MIKSTDSFPTEALQFTLAGKKYEKILESVCTHTSAPPHLEKVGDGGRVRVAERTEKAEGYSF